MLHDRAGFKERQNVVLQDPLLLKHWKDIWKEQMVHFIRLYPVALCVLQYSFRCIEMCIESTPDHKDS